MIPVTIVGGYLGAGKTTLINNMLRNASGQRLAILVNEFGELPIDEDLIEAESDEMISLAGGCICCSFGDNLVEALVSLSKLDPAPDHIVVEASGVAIPGSIAASLSLVLGFRLNALVVLADGGTALDLARDKYMGDTILRQLEDADLVVMTKTDLVSEAQRTSVMDWLKQVARGAAFVTSELGGLPNSVLLGPADGPSDYQRAAHHDGLFESATFPVPGRVDARSLADRLMHPELGVVRAKGFVRSTQGQTMLVQIAGGRADITKTAPRQSHDLVCIGPSETFDRAALSAVFDELGR